MQIQEAFKAHFQGILQGSLAVIRPPAGEWLQDLPSISEDHIAMLLTPFSNAEIKKTAFSSKPLKSPGPDGVPPALIQQYWTLVGPDIYDAVHSFFLFGVLIERG